MIVADASAVGSFLIPDEAGDFAEFARRTCLIEELHAPAHWSVEIASLLRKAKWRGRLTDDQAGAAADVADRLAKHLVVGWTPPISVLLAESGRLGLTIYDVAYLLLAQTLGCSLLTDDGALRRVALSQGLSVLTP